MRRDTRGFYTLEAAIFLPLVLLAVFSIGYFLKADGAWEKAMAGAIDESARASSMAYDGMSGLMAGRAVQDRLSENEDEDHIYEIDDVLLMYGDGMSAFTVRSEVRLELPLGFDREFVREDRIKYRNFVGRKYRGVPAGPGLLEKRDKADEVCIFPHSGKRYHHEDCTYVKPDVTERILTPSLKSRYRPCGTCDSGGMVNGSRVWCFRSGGTAYHRSSCSTVTKNFITVDRQEAKKKGYTPCRKCGGG